MKLYKIDKTICIDYQNKIINKILPPAIFQLVWLSLLIVWAGFLVWWGFLIWS